MAGPAATRISLQSLQLPRIIVIEKSAEHSVSCFTALRLCRSVAAPAAAPPAAAAAAAGVVVAVVVAVVVVVVTNEACPGMDPKPHSRIAL